MSNATTEEPKKTAKRDALRATEHRIQKIWQDAKVFEVNAPTLDEISLEQEISGEIKLHERYPKYMGTFPYPYMNGRLHLGHFFTIIKLEFATGYERMKGKRALFPLGFHCTGMPIKACADKLAREIKEFGPNFEIPNEIEDIVNDLTLNDSTDPNSAATTTNSSSISGKTVNKKGKVAAKSTGQKYQFQIMRSIGVPEKEIANFADANYWLSYFPPLAIQDCKSIGAKIDWRRSFITTDVNPYYDSFVCWQMRKLKSLNKIKFGERYTIYSPLDGQPCMDHDRQSGEGVGPQEYTVIKLKVIEWSEKAKSAITPFEHLLSEKSIFLVAATLRPETMRITYGLFKINETDIFLCTKRAARNMAFQGYSNERGLVTQLAEIKGAALIGTKVKAPLSKYEGVYVLPMENVLSTKGTGVVTSVPSDSPDDFATLQDLKKKPEYYNINPAWADFEPIPIINTPTYGDLSAPAVCKLKKINSQKDRVQLAEAKELVYKEGFYNGTMIYETFKGRTVQEAKPLIKDLLISTGQGFIYNEPESLVMSRSGDECVVALCDQWYLDYGEEKWRKQAEDCLSKMNTYGNETRHQFEQTLAWLNQWACARSYGLGSRLPWDPQYLVESLSDSTIYMAYYTVAHLLHGGTLDGSKPGPLGIKPSELTDEAWDYIFTDSASYPTNTTISKEKLDTLKREFKYFYPLDIRISGKDLIPNHLTFFIYNHVAIFPENYWPKGVRANGHLQLNREKMSKSTGNFMTGSDAIEKYGADATRVALADAGDAIEDANFEESTANAAILRLYTLREWCESQVKNKDALRTGPVTSFHDQVFINEVNKFIQMTDKAYEEGCDSRDWYREATSQEGMHRDLVLWWIEVQTLLLAPIAPHWSEHIWQDLLKKDSLIVNAQFPKATASPDESILKAAEYVRKMIKSVRDLENATQRKKKKGKVEQFNPSKPKHLNLFVATKFPEWQDSTVDVLRQSYNEETQTFDDAKIRTILTEKGLLKNKKTMPFVQEFKKRVEKFGASVAFDRALLFDEYDTLITTCEFFKRSLGYEKLDVYKSEEVVGVNTDSHPVEDQNAAEAAVPGEPGVPTSPTTSTASSSTNLQESTRIVSEAVFKLGWRDVVYKTRDLLLLYKLIGHFYKFDLGGNCYTATVEDMGTRIDSLEKSLGELMQQAIAEEVLLQEATNN
ncbi:14143_t:CDS:10 [Ambispora leptoticha]|uniref:leucine--tRNA ligase n=1 Tax=Ambispora leptoticha TaxID=144679 RepID=A0A9N9BJW5_9GLOM|nr:14143_t:CDS:10 [Ambispora leptoticha]